jgi:GNAT superfamily N-acetyltransferase
VTPSRERKTSARPARSPTKERIVVVPLVPERWDDLVTVFGAGRGVCGACWCMYWRLPRGEFEQSMKGGRNRKLFRRRVEAGPPPGLLAYLGSEPVGWVQVGPRHDVPNWNGPRRLTAATPDAPADDPAVWGISCFVTRSGYRRRGVSEALLDGAVRWARQHGARVLDACPVDVTDDRNPISLYHGVATAFERAGFREIDRRRADRPLMRLSLPRRRSGTR